MSADPLHGRGARTNASGRYERYAREAFDDGWGGDEIVPLETVVTIWELTYPMRALIFES